MSPVTMNIDAAASAIDGQVVHRGAERFEGLSIDSRRVSPGQAFLALAGDRFDGHHFIDQAIFSGARVLIVSEPPVRDFPEEVSVVQVRDTRVALAKLAQSWRREVAPQVVAITGSVGKTTTKELTAQVVRQLGVTHYTSGNYNNDIGLPLTLLAMDQATRYLVVELGMNAPGEIARLTEIAEPDIGLVTCIAPVHLEGVGSIEGVAAAKGELFQGLKSGAWAIAPGDEALLRPYLNQVPRQRRIHFGSGEDDDVRLVCVQSSTAEGTAVELSLKGERVSFRLSLAGEHNVFNAAAAAAVGLCLGVPPQKIAEALSRAPRLEHRSVVRKIGEWCLLDDCYNANPLAMKAALSTLPQLAGKAMRVAVLGAMFELGAEAERYHREVGIFAAGVGLDLLVTVGEMAEPIARGAADAGMERDKIIHTADIPQAAQQIASRVAPGAWILVKASRGARLEQIIDLLRGDEALEQSQDGDPTPKTTLAHSGKSVRAR